MNKIFLELAQVGLEEIYQAMNMKVNNIESLEDVCDYLRNKELNEARLVGVLTNILKGLIYKSEDLPFFEKVDRVADLDFNLPERKTKNSAGYDFVAIEDFTLQPKETKLVKTGVKAYMPDDMVLLLFVRSSIGIKNHISMANNVGIIDSDYYNNKDNEGEMAFALRNDGELPVTIHAGERMGQGIFTKYYKVENDEATGVRTGGIGSTNK